MRDAGAFTKVSQSLCPQDPLDSISNIVNDSRSMGYNSDESERTEVNDMGTDLIS